MLLALAIALAMPAIDAQIVECALRTIYVGAEFTSVWVQPYTRRDGVKVQGHWRSYRVTR